MKIADNISYATGRFFIDIAISGCGSACTYCYVKDAHENQILIDKADLVESLKCLINSPYFVKGKQGSIISLCPNTEPFKSKDSANLVLCILESFLPIGNPIQISTKESIPSEILEASQNLCIFQRQVFLHISTSCISKMNIIEPFASPIDIRFENFDRIKFYDKLTSCFYIKPFNNNTFKDLDKYIDLINYYKPDVVCVGIDFKKTTILDKPCDLLYHSKEVVEKVLDRDIATKIALFRKRIEDKTLIPVFHSSTCIISKFINSTTNSNIKVVAPRLCIKCGGCSN